MTSRLCISAVAAILCCIPSPCPAAYPDTEFVRTLPSAYVPKKPMMVFLQADCWGSQDFHAQLYEMLPPGWEVISSRPAYTSFDPQTGTIFWDIDIFSPFPLWGYPVSYHVVPPPSQTGEVTFEGNASYFFDWFEKDNPRFAVTTGDTALSRGSQQLRRVPEEYLGLQAAIDASEFGDTVLVHSGPGVYVENVVMQQGVDIRGEAYPPPEIGATSPSSTALTAAPHCSVGGITISSGWDAILCTYPGLEVHDCVITGSTHRAIDSIVTEGGTRIVNCTIAGNEGEGVYLGGEPSQNFVTNSVLFANGGLDVTGAHVTHSCLEDEIYRGSGENNIYADPMFVNAEAGDYRLMPGSPCIDTGDNTERSPDETDILGRPRILFGGKSETVDMGAYEYWFISSSRQPGSAHLEVLWSSRNGESYSLFFSDDLTTWHLADDNVAASEGVTTSWLDPIGWPPAVPIRLYKVMENK